MSRPRIEVDESCNNFLEKKARETGHSKEKILQEIIESKMHMRKEASNEDGMIKYGDIEEPIE